VDQEGLLGGRPSRRPEVAEVANGTHGPRDD